MTEDKVEEHACKRVKQARGLAIKLRFLRGWPDRIFLLPGAFLLFVEFKRPVGGKFEPLQERIHAKLRVLGFTVLVWNTKEQVDNYFQEYGHEQIERERS